MSASRLLLRLLEAAILLAVGAGIYVWLVAPIDTEAVARPIHWTDPYRPLKLAGALLALRLIVAGLIALWRRIGGRPRAVLSHPVLWVAVLAALGAVWGVRQYRAHVRMLNDIADQRESGWASLGLSTRAVLGWSDVHDGWPLPRGAASRTLQISCGAAGPAGAREKRVRGLLSIRSAEGRAIGKDEAADCLIGSGQWSDMTLRLPEDLPEGARLAFAIDPEAPRRFDERVFWSVPAILPEPDPGRLNLVLISLDTLRADHLGAYGYERPVSPNIDRLAARAVLFEKAVSQAPWTTPSHMSLFTSLYPGAHAVDSPTSVRQRELPPDRQTLAQILSKAGYDTAAFTGSGSISALYGFWRGFTIYDETDKDLKERGGEDVSTIFEKASRWLVEHHDRPFFLFFHTYEIHAPYTHETFVDKSLAGDVVARETALYDGDILYTDGYVGQLLNLIDGLGIGGRTVVVLLSDHGEELNPRYGGKPLRHGHTVYEELLHVPLIIAAPRPALAGRRVPEMVQIIDVMPTVLDLLHVPVPGWAQGKSLAAALAGAAVPARDAFSEATNYGPERKAIQDGRFKLIRTYPRAEAPARDVPAPVAAEELFDLKEDPGERHSLIGTAPPALERLREEMRALVTANAARRQEAKKIEVDPETLRRLKALGYVD